MIVTQAAIARATGGQVLGPGAPGRIGTDTRALRPGDWFLALVGERFDGHDFLDAAAEAGVAGVIAQRVPPGWALGAVRVPDTLRALQDLARAARDRLEGCPIIGLTGSAGKTTTRAMIAAAIGSLGPIHQTAGNLNNHIGLPLSLLAAPDPEGPDRAAALVLELGMSAPGEIALLQSIARPDLRLITNVAAAHLEGTGDLDGVARCKRELFDGTRPGDTVLVNADDERVAAMPIPPARRVIRYGASRGCDIRLIRAAIDPGRLTTRVQIDTGVGPLQVELAAPGLHLARDAAAAVAVARALEVAPEAIAEGLARWRPVGMRMRVERYRLPGGGGIAVLNDAYNANPLSTAEALRTLAAVAGTRRIALLGDMLELGEGEAEAHAAILELAAGLGLDRLGLAGPRYAAAARGWTGEALVAGDAEALRERIVEQLRPGDVLLVKGSRGLRMERTLRGLTPEEG